MRNLIVFTVVLGIGLLGSVAMAAVDVIGSPDAKVDGNLEVTGKVSLPQMFMEWRDSSSLGVKRGTYFTTYGNTRGIHFQAKGSTASNPGIVSFQNNVGASILTIRSNTSSGFGGNVGIHAENPEAPLEVRGAAGGPGRLRLVDPDRGSWELMPGGDATKLISNLLIYNTGLGKLGNILLAPNDQGGGNVGIGTKTPEAKLDVDGTTQTNELNILTGRVPDGTETILVINAAGEVIDSGIILQDVQDALIGHVHNKGSGSRMTGPAVIQ